MHTVVFFALLFVFVQSQNPDRIANLPRFAGTLGNQYSGYIEVDASAGRMFHYWFVESETDTTRAPLVLWLNGGPGCSSLDGFFYENGPFKFATNSTTPSLVDNPYSWHKVANMLFLESPAGVGFSYSTSGENDYRDQNDTRTANDNYTFLKLWFKQYPQYLKNDFWITGESYGGIYVPSLAKLVMDGILNNTFVIPFKGIMVGNGVANSKADFITVDIEFLFGHGIISRKLYLALIAACNTDPRSPDCQHYRQQASQNMNGIDVYDLYADCYHQRPYYDAANNKFFENLSLPKADPPCTDAYFATGYLGVEDVKVAIHVKTDITWSICSGIVNNYYHRTRDSMVLIHQYLHKNGIRILIYSGDADFSVPYTDSEYWTSMEMGLQSTVDWRQWYFSDDEGRQIAGFVTEYGPGFSFATIKGAGHMVPQYAPLPAFLMFSKTLSGQPL